MDKFVETALKGFVANAQNKTVEEFFEEAKSTGAYAYLKDMCVRDVFGMKEQKAAPKKKTKAVPPKKAAKKRVKWGKLTPKIRQQILAILSEKEEGTAYLEKSLGHPRTVYNVLARLRKEGVVEMVGGPSDLRTVYKLVDSTVVPLDRVEEMGKKAASA